MNNERINYTTKLLDKILLENTEKDITTTDITGMQVVLRPNREKRTTVFFKFKKVVNKKVININIGKYPLVSILEARKEFLKIQSNVAKGLDPKVQAIEGTKEEVTFGQVYREFMILKKPNLKENTVKKHQSLWDSHLKTLEHIDIKNFSSNYVLNFVDKYLKRGEYGTVNRITTMIKNVLEYAVFKNLIAFNPIISINKFLPTPEYKHFATFSDYKLKEELTNLFVAFSDQSKQAQLMLYMYFFTLLRNLELRELELANINDSFFEVKTKTLEKFRVPLTTQSKKVIDCLVKNHRAEGNPYLFEGTVAQKVSSNFLTIILKRKGYQGRFSIHGIRSCGRMFMQTIPTAKESLIEMCLSHVGGNKVEQAYNRGDYLEQRRAIMQDWCNFVEECAGDNLSILLN